MVPEISVQQLAERLKAGETPFLLDVRQPAEAALASLPGSVLVPLNQLGGRLEEVRGQVPAGTPIVVYCHHGMRSQMAANGLLNNGFKDVTSLAGGIDAWSLHVDPSVPRY